MSQNWHQIRQSVDALPNSVEKHALWFALVVGEERWLKDAVGCDTQSIALGYRLEHRDARRKCWTLKPSTFAYQILLCNPRSEALDGANARSYFVSAVQRYCSRVEDLRQSLGRVFPACYATQELTLATKTLDLGELHVALRMMPAPFQRYDRVAFYWKILGQCVLLYQG